MADKLVSVNDDYDFPAPVAARQAARLGDATTAEGKALNAAATSAAASKLDKAEAAGMYATKAEIVAGAPAKFEPIKLYAAGSSTMQGIANTLGSEVSYAGATIASSAVGGYKISNIAAAIGTRPVALSAVTIPTSGAVSVTPMNMDEPNAYSPTSWTGTLAGIPGTLAKPVNADTWTFTRTSAGAATTIPAGTAFTPSAPAAYRGGIALLNPGKNTLVATLLADWDVERVITMTESIADYFGGANGRVLYIGHFVDSNTPATSAFRDRITAFNNHFRTRYGARFFDLSAYVTGSQIWADTGITPNDTDRAQQALGNKPPSLSADAAHLNSAGYAAVNARIREKLTTLGWLPSKTAIPTDPTPPTEPAPATFSDNFDRADGLLAAPWKELAAGGATGSPVGKISGQKLMTDGAATNVVIPAPGGSSNYEVSARIAGRGATPALTNMSILLRANTSGDFYFLSCRATSSTEGFALWKSVGGTLTSIQANTTKAPAVGQLIKVRVVGDTFTVYVDGTQLFAANDATFTTGMPGLRIFGGMTTNAWDDFTVNAL